MAKTTGKQVVPEGEEAGYLGVMKSLIGGLDDAALAQERAFTEHERDAAAKYLITDSNPIGGRIDGEEEEEQDMVKMMWGQQGLDFVDIEGEGIDQDEVRELIRMFGGNLVKMYRILPLGRLEDGTVRVAISDPLNVTVVDDLRMLTDAEVVTVVAEEDDIMDHIEMIWGVGDTTIDTVLNEVDDGEGGLDSAGNDGMTVNLDDSLSAGAAASDAPIIRLVNSYLFQAIKDRASDLHIEPFRGVLRIRYRVDGHLRELPDPPKTMQLGIISRLKVLSNMDIAENRVPQDGRIRLTVEGREVDLRVSSIPTINGESLVMRVLDQSMMMLGVDDLGLSRAELEKFGEVITRPNGIVLVCGPTGSGKTTTLYAALAAINDPGDKIITTEDPVEYQLPGLVQVNINSSVGLTFAACLRSILRQDPDKILVGEIRDVETATIAIQAALTGHLVFSTVHSNSAAACATRLVDMGVEPFLLTSTLQAIIGQRLVRTICTRCAQPYEPTDSELEEFGYTRADVQGMNFMKGVGCEECLHSGYRGRVGIYEVLVFDDETRDLVLERATTDQVHAMATQGGMQTLRGDGWGKICAGITTFDEVARQTPREGHESVDLERKKASMKDENQAPPQELTAPAAPASTDKPKVAAPWESELAAKL